MGTSREMGRLTSVFSATCSGWRFASWRGPNGVPIG